MQARLSGWVATVVAAWSLITVASVPPVRGAEVTDVADAVDVLVIGETEKEDLFDMYVGAGATLEVANGKITREPINRPGVQSRFCRDASSSRDCLPVDEMRWKSQRIVSDFDMQIGLFHDLALTAGFHYIASETLKLRYAKDVTPRTSSVDPQTGNPADTLINLESGYKNSFSSKHQGAGPFDLGLKFGALSDERDSSKPAWVLFFNWSSPWSCETYKPGKTRPTQSSPGPVCDGVHRLTFGTGLSKRIATFGLIGIDPAIARRGFVDPYMEFSYVRPVPQRGLADPSNVRTRTNRFGRPPSHEARLKAGMEVVPVEDLKMGRRVAIDLGLRSAFFSEGRNRSELTDALGELTYTEQYLNVGGLLGIYIQAAEFIRFRAGVSLGYNTEHFLTNEEVGRDNNGDGQVLDPSVDTRTPKDDINPYFCGNSAADTCRSDGQPSYDQIGFRFKDEEHVIFAGSASLVLTF